MSARSEIDGNKLRKWVKSTGLPQTEICDRCGYSHSWLSWAMSHNQMSKAAFTTLRVVFGLPEDAFKPEPKPVAVAEPEQMVMKLVAGDGKQIQVAKAQSQGYGLSLQVHPNKVRVGMHFDGEEIDFAWAKIADNSEMALIQAISYAAHLIYKFAERERLAAEG